MAVWVVRQDAPKFGGWDRIALENGVAVIDFGLQTDISIFDSPLELAGHLRQNAHALYGYKSGPPGRVQNAARQVWKFYKCIAPGDIAVYHIWADAKGQEKLVRIGKFLDDDAYQSSFPDYAESWRPDQPDPIVFQVRRVNWLARAIPMSAFNPALKLDAPGTVYKPSYVDADAHVREVLQEHWKAGLS